MGLFSFCPDCAISLSASGQGLLPARLKSIAVDGPLCLWIKRVFGVCGELWLVFRFFEFHCGLSVDGFRSSKTMNAEIEWEKRG
jgi:hypothetical protein